MTVQQQIAEVQARRAAALEAEEKRLAAERSARDEVAAADAELARLADAQAEEAFAAAVRQSEALRQENAAAVVRLYAALDAADLRAIRAAAAVVVDTFNAQQVVADAALADVGHRAYEADADGAAAMAQAQAQADRSYQGQRAYEAAHRARSERANTARRQRAGELPDALHLYAALADGIAHAPNEEARRWRRAITWYLLPELEAVPNFGPNFSGAELTRQQSSTRRFRRRF